MATSTLKVSRSASPTRESDARGTASPPTQMRRRFAVLSDVGQLRHANEDACGASAESGVFVVCDGMGGAAAGEVASRLALDTFLSAVRLEGMGVDAAKGRLEGAIQAANAAVYKQAQRLKSLRGMGTTLVAMLLEEDVTGGAGNRVWVAHVGDSRAYRLRAGVLEPLTRDHSLVEEQIEAGLIERMHAESSPVRNIITRAIGSTAEVEPEIAVFGAEAGDVYLLASDGLTRELSEEEIAGVLAAGVSELGAGSREKCEDGGLGEVCEALVDAANARGGRDNITVVVIAFP